MTKAANGGERRVTCASCGKQVAPGARYCVHCGAEQSVPTPIAAVAAASMSRNGRREAANAAHAEPVHRPAATNSRRAPAEGPASVTPLAQDGVANAGQQDAPRQPAYADTPQRRGLVLAMIGCGVVVAIATGALFWRLAGERSAGPSENAAAPSVSAAAPASSSSSASEAQPAAAPSEATAPAGVSAAPASEAAAPSPAAPSATRADAGPPPEASAPVEIKPLPPHPAATRSAPPRTPAGATPAATGQSPKAAARSESASQTAPSTPTAAVRVDKAGAAQAAASRGSDRWQRMGADLASCTREDFIARVICGQRVRFRYCDGYWGKVPQCPGNPAPERGQ